MNAIKPIGVNEQSWSEGSIVAGLRLKFASPEFAFLSQVRNSTGFSRRPRTADALAMSTWPSRGIELYGFEVKCSRSDWLNEKKEPEKAHEIARYCDRWYLVVGNPNIVGPGELPPKWGLIIPKGSKLIVKTEAPKLEPEPMSKIFLAALLRRVSEAAVPKECLDAMVNERLKACEESAKSNAKWEIDTSKRDAEDLRERIRHFEEASGVKIEQWNGTRIGEAVKFVMKNNLTTYRNELENMKHRCEQLVSALEKTLSEPQ